MPSELDMVEINKCTQCLVVMFHYVRPLADSDFPKLTGLDIRRFIQQIDVLSQTHTFVGLDDYVQYLNGERLDIPKNPCVLTFDDGLRDHYEYVFPILKAASIRGCFFVSTDPLENKVVLPVHKTHFLLAAKGTGYLFDAFGSAMKKMAPKEYNEVIALSEGVTHKFDSKKTAQLKFMIRSISEETQREVLGKIFEDVLGAEECFSDNLYLSAEQIGEMSDGNMIIGSHAKSHRLLGELTEDEQREEILVSKKILEKTVHKPITLFSYPNSSHNHDTICLLREFRFSGAVIDNGGENERLRSPLLIQRKDTNSV